MTATKSKLRGPLDGVPIHAIPDDWWEQRQKEKEIAAALGEFGDALAELGSNVSRYMEISGDSVRAIFELEKRHDALHREAGHAIRSTAIYG